MKQQVSQQVFKRLLAGIGIFPLLVADITFAITPRPSDLSRNSRFAQIDGSDRCENIYLESLERQNTDFSNQLYEVINSIDSCSNQDLSRIFNELLIVLESEEQSIDDTDKTMVLHGLGAVIDQIRPETDSYYIDPLDISRLLSIAERLLKTQRTTNSAESWQLQTSVMTLLSKVAILSVASSNGDQHLEKLVSFFVNSDDSLITLDISNTEDARTFHERLSAGSNASQTEKVQAATYRAQVAFHLTALKALKDIGQGLQQYLARSDSDYYRGQLKLISENTDDLLKKYLQTVLEIENRDVASDALLIDIRIATIEALAASIFYPSSSSNNTNVNCPIRTAEDEENGNDVEEETDSPYVLSSHTLCLLNMIAANAEETGEVRAGAIAAIERLGSVGDRFYSFAVRNLYGVAQEDLDEYHNDRDAIEQQTAEQLSALDIASRLDARREPQSSGSLETQSNSTFNNQANDAGVQIPLRPRSLSQGADNLFVTLEQGFAVDKDEELRQTAEVAFRQYYSKDFRELVKAAEGSINGSRNERLQLSATKAAGGVNYRRLNLTEESSDSLEKLAVFLGRSLSSRSWEIRQQAAYALGQIASFHPKILQQQKFAYKIDGGEISVLEALFLGLNDYGIDEKQSENVIATVAFTIGRYGRALEQTSKAVELKEKFGLSGDNESAQGITQKLQELKTCLKVMTIPTSVDMSTERFNAQNNLGQVLFEFIKSKKPHELRQTLSLGQYEYEMFLEEISALAAEMASDISISWQSKSNTLHETCKLEIPNVEVSKTDRAAVAAAFVLGQIGISDGKIEASLEEKQIVEDLLWVLRVRDVLLASNDSNTFASDSVRDSIASYVFAQIDSREHDLIERLLHPITLPDPRIDQPIKDEYLSYFHNPVTRAVVIEALDQIGLERTSLRQFISYKPDDGQEKYISRFRRLLTSDLDASNRVQAAVTSVVESSNSRADAELQELWEGLYKLNEQELHSSDRWLDANDQRRLMRLSRNLLDALENDSKALYDTANDLNQAQHTLSLPYSSLLACAGSGYALEAVGIDNDAVVQELMDRIYVYPQPYRHFCASNRQTVSNLEEPGTREPVLDEPSLIEQLRLMKSGAIAALGQIDPYYWRRQAVVSCLVSLAGNSRRNLTPNANCPVNVGEEGKNNERRNRQLDWCLTPAQYQDFRQHPYFDRYFHFDSLEYGIVSHEYSEDRLTDPTAGDPLTASIQQSRCLPSNLANGSSRLPERLPDFAPEDPENEEQRAQLPAEYQAEGWGIEEVSDYYLLRQELRRPALEALGQIALREPDTKALKALVTLDLGSIDKIPIVKSNNLNLVRVELLEEIALYVQASTRFDRNQKRDKIALIINEGLLPLASTVELDDTDDTRLDTRLSDTAVGTLSLLGPNAFEWFSASEREIFIKNLGFRDFSSDAIKLAQDCENASIGLLRRENLCLGLTNIVSSAWHPEINRESILTKSVTDTLRRLAEDKESAVIRASAVQALGKINQSSNDESYYLLLGRLGNDEPRVVAQSIQSFLQANPREVIPKLAQDLEAEATVAWQAAHAIRLLAQVSYSSNAENSHPDWQTALPSSTLTTALVARLRQSTFNTGLANEIIYALGEMRTASVEAQDMLQDILISSTDSSSRAAAAYALGKIGNTHPRLGSLALTELHSIAVNASGSETIELQATAAHAVSQIGVNAYRTMVGLDPQEVLNALLIAHYNSDSTDSDELKAVLLYSMGQLGFDDSRVSRLFVNSLKSDQPFNIRAIAATYSGGLLHEEWECALPREEPSANDINNNNYVTEVLKNIQNDKNTCLTEALINAVNNDEDITVRKNAAISLGTQIAFTSEKTSNYYRKRIIESLTGVFWNEREYPSVRIEAGNSLRELARSELGSIELTLAFEATFENLGDVEKLRSGLRSSQVGTLEQVLLSVRSETLISRLDNLNVNNLLTIILNSIRAERDSVRANASRRVGSEQALICQVRWFRGSWICNL
ncbi:HEAT repeat domain-containing protein [Leptothoe sp. ISB3NOV94-8A]